MNSEARHHRAAAWQRALAAYPVLQGVPPPLDETANAPNAPTPWQLVDVPARAPLFDEGQPCAGFPMVLAGEVRVARGSAQGRQIELYRVAPGEVCVVSTACLAGRLPMSAHARTTQPTQLLLVPPALFDAWCEHAPFRRFVFEVFGARLADLMALAEAVAFQRLDQRLAALLAERGDLVLATHQHLADELGTVREIVTRLLRRFERAGAVRCAREKVQVLDRAWLLALADGRTAAR